MEQMAQEMTALQNEANTEQFLDDISDLQSVNFNFAKKAKLYLTNLDSTTNFSRVIHDNDLFQSEFNFINQLEDLCHQNPKPQERPNSASSSLSNQSASFSKSFIKRQN